MSNNLNPRSNKNKLRKWIEERDICPCQARVGSRGIGTRQIKNRQQIGPFDLHSTSSFFLILYEYLWNIVIYLRESIHLKIFLIFNSGQKKNDLYFLSIYQSDNSLPQRNLLKFLSQIKTNSVECTLLWFRNHTICEPVEKILIWAIHLPQISTWP